MRRHTSIRVGSVVLGLLVLSATTGTGARAQQVDPVAVQLLRRSMDYLGNLQEFTVTARNFREDLLPSGHRVDYEMAGKVTVVRPNKLRAERLGKTALQVLFYDGKTLTLYNPPQNVYASKPAPGTIPQMFMFAFDSLDLYLPMTDLIWPDVFPLLMKDVTYAAVIDKEIIEGVSCDHLVFSRPHVDFQIWIADSGDPWPLKYIVTDPSTPEQLSIVTTMSSWKPSTTVSRDYFTFVPPKGATSTSFLPPQGDKPDTR